MTPIEEEAVRLVVQTVTREAMDDGLRTLSRIH